MKTYTYDAFRNPLPVQPTANGEPPVLALARALLYGDGGYDPRLALCYVPIRPSAMPPRFTSLDPHAGEAQAPANLQRFGYSGQAPLDAADSACPGTL